MARRKKSKIQIKDLAIDGISVGAGIFAAKKASELIPIQNPKVKSALIFAGGAVMAGQDGIIGKIGLGMAGTGAVQTLSSFGIGGPMLAGTKTMLAGGDLHAYNDPGIVTGSIRRTDQRGVFPTQPKTY